MVAGAAQIPGALVLTMLVVAFFGWWPRATAIGWAVFAASVAVTEFGVLWSLPQWLVNVSVFHAAPMLPVDSSDAGALVLLLLIAAALGLAGAAGWRRRDLVV
jgi:ABC-2 type transport system permease protein